MIAIYFSAFLLLSAGILSLLHLTPISLLSALFKARPRRKAKLTDKVRNLKPKKQNPVKRIFSEANNVLITTHRENELAGFCTVSLALAISGLFIASLMGNVFLMPILCIGFALLPFLYILLSSFRYQKKLNNNLETALSVVNAEYIRTEDIVSAISESIDSCRSPVRNSFEYFITQVTSINPDVTLALEHIRGSVSNSVWQEWIDAVILCQQDRTLISTLQPIVRKLSDVRIVSGDLNADLYEPFREWSIMGGLLLFMPILIRMLNTDWFNILMFTMGGHIIIAVDMSVFFISLIRVIRLTRPVEYRR